MHDSLKAILSKKNNILSFVSSTYSFQVLSGRRCGIKEQSTDDILLSLTTSVSKNADNFFSSFLKGCGQAPNIKEASYVLLCITEAF